MCLYRKFRTISSSSLKNFIVILIEIALNLQTTLGITVILIILILPIQEHDMSFHLPGSSSIFFITTLQFSHYRCFTSIGRLITWYFILFHVMVDGVLSLNSLSDNSILVYRFIYINFVSSNFTKFTDKFQQLFSGVFKQDFLCILSCHLQTVRVLFLPFQIKFLFYFSSMISVVRTSKLMLNKSGESGHQQLVPDLNGNAAFHRSDYDVNCEFFVYGLYYVEACSLSGPPCQLS